MFRIFIFIFLSFSVQANDEIQTFFSHYIELEKTYDTSIGDLYLDDAIVVINHDVKGHPPIKIAGAELKKDIIRLADTVRKNKDFNVYTNIIITDNQDGTFLIKADRTSNMLCYTDKSYSMTVIKDASGNVKIIKENGFVASNQSC